jgi:hypothetical protein
MHKIPFLNRLVVASLLILFIVTVLFESLGRPMGFQWDYFVFYQAALSWRHGLNPYDFSELVKAGHANLSPYLSFTYMPLIAPLFVPFTFFSPAVSAGIWVLLKCVLFILMLRWCRDAYKYSWRSPTDLAILFFGFNSTLFSDLMSGNTSLLQFPLVWLGVHWLLNEKYEKSAVAFAVTAFVKLQPILLLILLFLAPKKRRWLAIGLGIFVLVIFWLANKCLYPEYYQYFLREAMARVQAEGGVLAPSLLAFCKELVEQMLGVSVMPELLKHMLIVGGKSLYGLIVFLIVSVVLYVANRYQKGKVELRQKVDLICFLLLTYILIVPRVKSYDLLLVLPIASRVLEYVWVKYRSALLLLLCLPVFFPMNAPNTEHLFSTVAQLGVVRKNFYLCYQYLPYWNCLILWGVLAIRILRIPVFAPQAL